MTNNFSENDIQIGDICLTRNLREEDNRSPGYWNHAAIYIGDLYHPNEYHIVEAQINKGVLKTSYLNFYNRYPQILILRHIVLEKEDMYSTARAALFMVGSRYWRAASIFRFMRPGRRGENCVSLIRRSTKKATGTDFGWRIPDNIRDDQRLAVVFEKTL